MKIRPFSPTIADEHREMVKAAEPLMTELFAAIVDKKLMAPNDVAFLIVRDTDHEADKLVDQEDEDTKRVLALCLRVVGDLRVSTAPRVIVVESLRHTTGGTDEERAAALQRVTSQGSAPIVVVGKTAGVYFGDMCRDFGARIAASLNDDAVVERFVRVAKEAHVRISMSLLAAARKTGAQLDSFAVIVSIKANQDAEDLVPYGTDPDSLALDVTIATRAKIADMLMDRPGLDISVVGKGGVPVVLLGWNAGVCLSLPVDLVVQAGGASPRHVGSA